MPKMKISDFCNIAGCTEQVQEEGKQQLQIGKTKLN